MKIFNNTTKTMLTTAFITAGAYLAGSGTKIMDSKYEELNTQNDKLNTELFQKNLKINSLEQDIVELKKQKASIEFKHQLDSLEKYPAKDLNTDFYERIINNAALLDNNDYPYRNMKKIVNKIPDAEITKINDVFEGRTKASYNLTDFANRCPNYFDD